MELPKPLPLPYDIRAWRRLPFAERLKLVCRAWAVQGYGAPGAIYLLYAAKVAFYIAMWRFFCSFTPELGWMEPVAFQKAVLWSLMFESLGLGCGSGPLSGRYFPPVGGALYFARPGTTKLPLFPELPVLGGFRRSTLDVALYVAHELLLLRALVAPAPGVAHFLPIVALLPLLGLADKTLFLASRAEHYGAVLVCCLFPDEWIAGSKIVWLAIWLWAATSKLNRHFPSVVTVMLSNSPLTRRGPLRRWLYRRYPDDLLPSRLAHALGHAGTLTEYAFPAMLVAGGSGPLGHAGLVVMTLFHLFITSCVPMAVPIEWNFLMVYGAWFLFGVHADVSPLAVSSPALASFLAIACVAVPLAGNLFPSRVSFLCAMRYYAGNWPYSIWLFKGDSSRKLDECLVKAAPRVPEQLRRFYDEDAAAGLLSKIQAFRAMHLHGRAVQRLLPRAVPELDEYEYVDGELVVGVVLGWNFGDGHLHDLRLLRAVQSQCRFAEGELRCLFVEAQPMGRSKFAWSIADAATGVRETGEMDVRELVGLQPWPT